MIFQRGRSTTNQQSIAFYFHIYLYNCIRTHTHIYISIYTYYLYLYIHIHVYIYADETVNMVIRSREIFRDRRSSIKWPRRPRPSKAKDLVGRGWRHRQDSKIYHVIMGGLNHEKNHQFI